MKFGADNPILDIGFVIEGEGTELKGHEESCGVWGVAFSPPRNRVEAAFSPGRKDNQRERLLLSGGGDGVLRVWSNREYTCLRKIRYEGKIGGLLCYGHRLIIPVLKGDGIDLVFNEGCVREVVVLDLQTWQSTHRIQLTPHSEGNTVISPMVVSSGHLIIGSNSDANTTSHPAVAIDLGTCSLSAVIKVGAPCRALALGGTRLFAGLRQAPWLKAMPVE